MSYLKKLGKKPEMICPVSLSVRSHESATEFLAEAGTFLGAREAEHNLLFAIAGWVRDNPELFTDGQATFATVACGDGRVIGATLRTPPHNQVLSCLDDLAAVDVLVEALEGESLPGVLGPKDVAAQFARAWSAVTGQPTRVTMEERIFRLTQVIPLERRASGSWRFVGERDRDRIADWLVEFTTEALPDEPPPPDPLVVADRWIARVGRTGYVWEDAGQVVSLVGAGGETPHGIRIGPVYTPPALRGQGYASALTAAVSQDQLNQGRRFVFLFTDLANPTSNRIYQAIGYEAVSDVDQYRFGA